jgi:hypothetical protein
VTKDKSKNMEATHPLSGRRTKSAMFRIPEERKVTKTPFRIECATISPIR